MKALIYLIKRTAANNLKKAVRKPTTLLALIFGAAYGIFLIVMLGTLAVTVRIDSVQGLVILVTVWTIYRLDGFSCGMVEDAFLLSDWMRRRVCGRTICYDHFIYE